MAGSRQILSGDTVMRGARQPGSIWSVEGTRRVVLQLELDVGEQRSVSGIVRAGDGRPHEFAGWSEMFALLDMLTAERGSAAETAHDA